MRLDPSSLPFLSDEGLEGRVRRLLAHARTALRRDLVPPIPVDEILERVLRVTFEVDSLSVRLGVPGALGATWFDARGPVVIDESLGTEGGRFFFTLAHETGHFVLHRPWALEQQALWGPLLEQESVVVVCGDLEAPARPRVEVQADRFAAALLMPRNALRATVYRVRRERGLDDEEAYVRAVADVGNFANVSLQALRIRLRELGLLTHFEHSACG